MKITYLILSTLLISTKVHSGKLPLDMTMKEYQKHLQSLVRTKSARLDKQNVAIQKSIDAGTRLLDWINLVNKNRDQAHKVRLTSKGGSRGIPIENPSEYGPKVIEIKLDKLLQNIPLKLKNVLFLNGDMSSKLPVSDDVFIKWGRKLSSLYQTSIRWTSLSRWLGYYSQRKRRDVRGFYHLKNWKNLEDDLSGFDTLSSKNQNLLKEYLYGLCLNNNKLESFCQRELQTAVLNNDLVSFKDKFWIGGENTWKSFFEISRPRRDVNWSSKYPDTMEVVFKKPKNDKIAKWLKENVEDEFRLEELGFQLKMKFIEGKYGTSHLEFKPNVTPHVTGGDKIVMDAKTDIEEYGVRWTIRHEYGHILRIPDCYHEFYDSEKELMINYQLDVTDLMCSRAGKMNERIYKELKRAYLKK